MASYTYICGCCKSTFTKNYIMSKGNWRDGIFYPTKKYCSKECRQTSRAKERKYKECKICNTKFRVIGNNGNIYCSKKCYGADMSNNPKEFGLVKRAKKMRESWGESSWKKSIETRKSNGNIIDWDVAEWKQYWRRCNDLTRKIRGLMRDNWDGIDYIDGEDISANFALPHTHGDYPTLDHIIPRSEGFKRGLTPYEITTPENLKWTKRKNNSKKYNKVG